MPPAWSEHHGSGLVLEEPAGEVAPRPIGGARDADGAASAAATREDLAERDRHAVVGDELTAHGSLVARGDGGGVGAPFSRIASAASTPVSSACPMPSPVRRSVAPAASPTNSARPVASGSVPMRGGDRPRLVRRFGDRVGPEHRPDVRAARASRATAASSLASRSPRRAGCRTRRSRVRRRAGTTTRSPAAGRSRTTPTAASPRAGPTSREVLTEGVPLAEVAGLAGAEQLAQRRPHAVGADRHVGARRCRGLSTSSSIASACSVDPGQRCAFVHLGAGVAGAVQEQRIELGATDDGRVDAAASWQRQLDDAARRRSHPRGVDGLP